MDIWKLEPGRPAVAMAANEALPGTGYAWLDLAYGEVERLQPEVERLTGVRIFDDHVSDAGNAAHPSFFDNTDQYELVIFRGLAPDSGAEKIVTRPMTLFNFDRLLVTVRAPDSRSVTHVKNRFLATAAKCPGSPDELMHRLLSSMVDHYLELRQPLTQRLDRWQTLLLDPRRPFRDWGKLLEDCQGEHPTGLIEVASDSCDGFVLLQEGNHVETESFFSTKQGFLTSLGAALEFFENPWQITLYEANRTSQAYQCTLLRLGATNWINKILSRYQDLVGQRMLQFLDTDLNNVISTWQWDIHFDGTGISDQHFFFRLQPAVDAYREIFMEIGDQTSFILGNSLSTRLLLDTFRQLSAEESGLLVTQRLIPAAFVY